MEPSQKKLKRLRKNGIIIHTNVPNHLTPAVIKDIDVLFNPVLVPSISRTTIEAMYCGRPVIRYKCGDRYPLIHEKNDFLINGDKELLKLLHYLNENRYS